LQCMLNQRPVSLRVSTEPHGKAADPYRVFFPLGILLGLAGVAIWPAYYFGITSGYSGRAHAFVQICGFLYCFAAGFLLTAIPRFTGTEAPRRPAQYALAGLIVVSSIGFELQVFVLGHAAFLGAHLVLIAMAARRFLNRKQDPPATFALVGAGVITGFLAGALNVAVSLEVIAPSWDLLGKRLLTEGMFLMLVLGVGGFLGPRLLGFAALPKFDRLEPVPVRINWMYAAAGIVLLFSLIAEYGFEFAPASFIRALTVSLVLGFTVRPWQLPAVRTTLAWCVWSANLLIVAGVWLTAFAPAYRADFLHVLFIGGFTLLIFAIGTRVTLSHGGHPLSHERKSWPLRIGLVTGLIAMLARVGAPFAPETYFDHLAYAALLWIAGVLLWGIYVIRLIRKHAA
jgi:uncharacterized protein involved in response to NO